MRALGYVEGGRLRLASRNGRDITPRYPELRELGRALGSHEAVLDGEVVSFGPDGKPSFQRLQGRMHLASENAVRRMSQREPVTYVIFDLLFLDGHSLMALPYEERRERLVELGLNGPAWQTPAHRVGDGAPLLEATRMQGLEGDHRQAARLPVRARPPHAGVGEGQELPPRRRRRRRLAAGGGQPVGALGRAGRRRARRRRRAASTPAASARGSTSASSIAWVGCWPTALWRRRRSRAASRRRPRTSSRPELVASVEYSEWTQAGTLRQPSYKGLRDDVDPLEVTRPEP